MGDTLERQIKMEKSFRFCYPLMYPIPEFNSKSFHNLTESGKQRITVVAKGEGAGRGLDWELGIRKCKLDDVRDFCLFTGLFMLLSVILCK